MPRIARLGKNHYYTIRKLGFSAVYQAKADLEKLSGVYGPMSQSTLRSMHRTLVGARHYSHFVLSIKALNRFHATSVYNLITTS
jgi:hypothetical protein